ncbi:hypothetical protein PTSG_12159 [Salpingoeca rosetta]|uniref:Uncharacterized protein n=1 Tax=Salpingoeca rosetta (strain ATCC 50818 / BSB-021) TaxID=946362 RepID=F2U8A6_SALR5|nr:uncharacterized protein PTSG_12159 [Salpingoeca rosetta]EGD72614.1 hypothetical protein PTSG_12159 [Salpingoeca rosetta]|eukprot:XP_004994437.1 hypothetical protein PTSG_12159 [Salpingoeca rosetta]
MADVDERTDSYRKAVGRSNNNSNSSNSHNNSSNSDSNSDSNAQVAEQQQRSGSHRNGDADGPATTTSTTDKGAGIDGKEEAAAEPSFKEHAPKDETAPRYTRSPIDKPLTTPLRWFMYITFSYLNPLCRLGAKRQLNSEDLFPIPSAEEARQLADRVEREWEKERHKKNGSLVKAYMRTFWGVWCFTSLLLFIETLFQIMEPVFLGQIVRNLQNDGDSRDAYKWAGALISTVFAHLALHHVAFMFSWRCGYQLMAGTIGIIYRKALRINKHSFTQMSTGHVVNLVSNDVERFILFSVMGPYFYLGPIQTMIASYFVWQQLGAITLTGVGLYILLLPLNYFLGKVFASLRHSAAVLTDERVKVINEVLTGMRVLKMYGWEEPFRRIVQNIRDKELRAIKRTNIIRGSNMAFFGVSAVLTSFLSFVTYQTVKGGLTAEKVFSTIAMFQAIRLNISFFFPNSIQLISELGVSFERFERFLRLREHVALTDTAHIQENLRSYTAPDHTITQDEETQLREIAAKHRAFVHVNNLSAKWTETMTLRDVSLTATPGKLISVVGPVGSGKSSLLMSILGELDPFQGAVHACGSTGFASQEPWILNATIRDNIIFGREYDQERFSRVVNTCQLTTDLRMMPDGASTDIGERGVTLSGGQKARISLARAVYADADIYLLDDPLSAVDAKVGRQLFEGCIRGALRNKVVILVTHQLQFLRQADELIVLGEGGDVLARGTYDDLMAEDIGLANVLKQIDHDTEEAHHQHHGHEEEGGYDDGSSNSLVEKEHRQEGVVGFSTYMSYARAAVPALFIAALWLLLCAGAQALQLSADWFLSYWVELDEAERNKDRNLIIYGILVALFVITCFGRAITFMMGAARASAVLNDTAFKAVVATSIRFFDTNPVGRILNRFSKDMGFLDDLLPWTFCDFLQNVFFVMGIVLLVCSINPFLFITVLPLAIGFNLLQRYFLKTAREMKRIEAINRSPVYSHFSTSLAGLPTLRSQDAMQPFTRTFERYQNDHGRAFMAFVMVSRWLGVRLDAMTFIFTSATLFGCLALRDRLGAGEVGLAITYVLQLTGCFQWVVRQGAEVENQMTSVERIVEYSKLQTEEEFVGSPTEESVDSNLIAKCSPTSWPADGKLEFVDLSLRYAPDTPLRLDGVSCVVPPGAKVGIVGRTGAGKSSLLAALFRLAPTTGDILIDDVPSSQLPLHVLRRKIGVIPQDPVLFSGSVRYNLDPFSEHDDAALWNALRLVQLDRAVTALPGGLEEEMSEAGGNFSVGQRQLVCMARAILQSSRVLVMDEATANVDTETDRLIQETIRTQFRDCTVLTIAHRLHTIMDCDLIMVMDAGRLVEYAPPEELVHNEDSLFCALAKQARLRSETVVNAASRRTSSVKFTAYKKMKAAAAAAELEAMGGDGVGVVEEEPGDTTGDCCDEEDNSNSESTC